MILVGGLLGVLSSELIMFSIFPDPDKFPIRAGIGVSIASFLIGMALVAVIER